MTTTAPRTCSFCLYVTGESSPTDHVNLCHLTRTQVEPDAHTCPDWKKSWGAAFWERQQERAERARRLAEMPTQPGLFEDQRKNEK